MCSYTGFVYEWVNHHPEATVHRKYIGQHIGSVEIQHYYM